MVHYVFSAAITEITHSNRLENLVSMAEDMKIRPIQTDYHKCGFGHFYYSVGPISAQMTTSWVNAK